MTPLYISTLTLRKNFVHFAEPRMLLYLTNYCPLGSTLKFTCTCGLFRTGVLRAILNFTPGPQGGISPLGVNLAPRGETHPWGITSPLGVKVCP
jgi:hypothetical protein